MPDSPSQSDDPFTERPASFPEPASPGEPPLSRRAARAAAEGESVAPTVSATSGPAPSPAPPAPSAPQQAAVPAAPRRPSAHGAAAATLDDLFTGTVTSDQLGSVPPKPNRRRRRIGGWIALGVVLLVLGGAAAGGLWVWNTYEGQIRSLMGWEEPADFEAGEATGEVTVSIISGDTGQSISQTLFDSGVTKTPDAFYDMLIDTGQNPNFVPGAFRLQLKMTSAAALSALLDPANKLSNTAQLREGLTVAESLPILAEGLAIPLEDFQAAVADPTVYGIPLDPAVAAAGGQPLEGWLFPATYTFDPGVTASDVIRTLVNRTMSSLDAAAVPVDDRQRILTIASVIQREARYEVDMQKVSRVIENRMDPSISDTNGLLQMDSTAQYGYGEMHDGTVSSSGEALRDDNPWNTYVHTGLPVGPIANPGDVAIQAAMNPAEGDWQYFVTVNLATGETIFTSNFADHERAVAQWQQWCRDNPDGGC